MPWSVFPGTKQQLEQSGKGRATLHMVIQCEFEGRNESS